MVLVDTRRPITATATTEDRVPERLAVRVVQGGVVQRQIGVVLP